MFSSSSSSFSFWENEKQGTNQVQYNWAVQHRTWRWKSLPRNGRQTSGICRSASKQHRTDLEIMSELQTGMKEGTSGGVRFQRGFLEDGLSSGINMKRAARQSLPCFATRVTAVPQTEGHCGTSRACGPFRLSHWRFILRPCVANSCSP